MLYIYIYFIYINLIYFTKINFIYLSYLSIADRRWQAWNDLCQVCPSWSLLAPRSRAMVLQEPKCLKELFV